MDKVTYKGYTIEIEEEWCECCKNPMLRYRILWEGHCGMAGIGGYSAMDALLEDAKRDIDGAIKDGG